MRRLIVVSLFVLASVAWADDEVKLKNGDRLTGTIKEMAGGKLILETKHSGPVTIDWAQVASVKTDAPVKVKLATGDMVEGKISPGAEGKLKVESSGTVAPVEVEMAKITKFNELPPQWHGNINAAGRASDGNTHTKSFLIAAEGLRVTEQDEFLLRAIFRYGRTGQALTERNGYGIAKYSYKFSPAFYGYVSEEILSDTFKDLRLESITSLGAGYEWVKSADIDFSTEAGFAYFSNDFRVANDESHPGGRLAAKLRVALPLGFEFKDTFILYPNFTTSQDYQFRNEATLGTALGSGWTLLGGVITEFDNKPSPGLNKQDDTFFVGLGYKF